MNLKNIKFNWHWLVALLTLGVFVLAISSLYHMLHDLDVRAVKEAVKAIPVSHLLGGLAIVGVGYWILALYDSLALRYLKLSVPNSKVVFTSLTAYAVGHSVGLAIVSAGSVRYRLYSAVGLTPLQIAAVMVLVSVTFTFGISFMAGVVLLLRPEMMSHMFDQMLGWHLAVGLVQTLGGLLVAGIIGLALWAGPVGRRLQWRQWYVDMPSSRMLLMQTGASVLDIITVALALYILLPSGVSYIETLTAFVMSMVIGILSHVPGGLGVFEVVMLNTLTQLPKAELAATLLIFRIFYYLLPFGIALLLLLVNEGIQQRDWIKNSYQSLHQRLKPYLPDMLLAIIVVVVGLVILISFAVAHQH
ncbi:UPF0104 family protein [Thiofilum flexile]|uniref:UPF0104 family protein n=1 Tax=Thiofilum flexile TaxID=125627 RepID=UPI000372AD47|nr:UPF0104 family protein [Thiofilum flexile]